ncbi:hypothetical protein C1Q25_003860 [Salmonella enterica subsp. enterica serovar 4,[5],12:i:-]|uniref:Uncharacterized protein n=5 Tax=Salmonella enterica TaxID=28901 RepID=A0A738QWJ2_SALET|nr:hypothetical protein [Salmonella enterica]EDN4086867.1 hypothetical protein [Salmonella enterica subsp. enterica serovar Typhimurium]EDN4437457.1 hypothetical protein [Salmonella enterica subsp. enterica serovar Java]EDN4858179.1 hypothetical protein [Salmonella enterica subsp. enterica serovar 4,[5],12:i:-]EDN4927168.1 hypothetical protein [Salmonella enterica subsp. enterica]EDP9083705.1 hypothetical protein [Salmonella enterica subsp. enterica serovar Bareilly]EDQ4851746.1 hypothetical 
MRTFAARGITATARRTCPGQNAKVFAGLLRQKVLWAVHFTLDSQCGGLWLYQPPATGT